MLLDGDRMPGARSLPKPASTSCENLLRRRDDADAVVFWSEDRVRRRLSHRELYDQVARVARALRASGVEAGDRVAAILPNLPETVVAMLASASLGATWCSCSPDFGVQGVVESLCPDSTEGSVRRRRLLCSNGKTFDCLEKLDAIVAALPTLERIVVVPYTRANPAITRLQHSALWDDFMAKSAPGEIESARLPFDRPLCVLYSRERPGYRSASSMVRAAHCWSTSRSSASH